MQNVLNYQNGLCYRVPFTAFLQSYQDRSKKKQLFIQQPHVCALVFARNEKNGCFTGFFQNIWKTKEFDTKKFLLAHALPGPGSRISCMI